VEMTWRTFGGEFAGVYLALLRDRCCRDRIPLTKENLVEQLHLHIQRGIGYLVGDPRLTDLTSLIQLGTTAPLDCLSRSNGASGSECAGGRRLENAQ